MQPAQVTDRNIAQFSKKNNESKLQHYVQWCTENQVTGSY